MRFFHLEKVNMLEGTKERKKKGKFSTSKILVFHFDLQFNQHIGPTSAAVRVLQSRSTMISSFTYAAVVNFSV